MRGTTIAQKMLDDLWTWYRYQRDMMFCRCPSVEQFDILWGLVDAD